MVLEKTASGQASFLGGDTSTDYVITRCISEIRASGSGNNLELENTASVTIQDSIIYGQTMSIGIKALTATNLTIVGNTVIGTNLGILVSITVGIE